jgi:heptosyltransferase III
MIESPRDDIGGVSGCQFLRTDLRPLVIFPGALGDLVCFVPALREIAERRGGRPILWCKGDLVPLVEVSGLADPRPIEGREASWLFSAKPPAEADEVFGAFASVDSFTGAGNVEVEGNLARWQGARARVHRFRPDEAIHIALHFLRCVAPEWTSRIPPEPKLSLPRGLVAPPDRGPALVVHPGSGGRSKRWSRSGFHDVARLWRERFGVPTVVLGPAEEGEAEDWRRTADVAVVTDLDVVALAGFLAACDAYLGNDSGVSHLAAAVGARGVALFGPTDPERWRPISERLVSLRLEPWSACDEGAPRGVVDAVAHALVTAGVSP